MINRTFLWTVALTALAYANPLYSNTLDQFDSDNLNWTTTTVNNSSVTSASSALWSSSGGNPGGNIFGNVDNAADRLYTFDAIDVANFGDLTGKTFTTDFLISGSVDSPQTSIVRFYIGTFLNGENNFFVSNDAFSWDPNTDTTWTTHQVELLLSNFVIWPNLNAGTKTFDEILAVPESFGLVFASDIASFTTISSLGFTSTDGATISVDNFGVVPLPATLPLILSGLIGFFGMQKFRKT